MRFQKYILTAFLLLIFSGRQADLIAQEDYLKKADTYFQQGKFSLAEIFYKKALQEKPENFQANYNLGKVYYFNNDYPQAIDSFKRAYDLKQDNDSLFYLANSYAQNNNPMFALTLYSNLIKKSPDYADAYLNAGFVGYKYIYNKYITITNWEKFLVLKPSDPQSPNIRKALEYLRDPNFILAPPDTKPIAVTGQVSVAGQGPVSASGASNSMGSVILPEIKGKDLKSESEEKYELRKRKSITTE